MISSSEMARQGLALCRAENITNLEEMTMNASADRTILFGSDTDDRLTAYLTALLTNDSDEVLTADRKHPSAVAAIRRIPTANVIHVANALLQTVQTGRSPQGFEDDHCLRRDSEARACGATTSERASCSATWIWRSGFSAIIHYGRSGQS